MLNIHNFKAEIGVGVTAASLTAAAMWYMKRISKTESIPTNWIEVGRVDQLLVYPLKSGAPLKCTQFLCSDQGPVHGDSRDRVLAIVREDGSMVTGRDFPELTQVFSEVRAGSLILAAGDQPQLTVNLNGLQEDKQQAIQIWKTPSSGVDCGDEAAAYLSRFLPANVRLLYFPDRQNGKSVYRGFLDLPFIRPSDGGVFSDAMSFHLVNEASIKDLNSRLERPVNARNFRPNIIVDGEALLPYEEDSWEWIKIGDVIFRGLAPCTRCLFTTVNPDTGEKSEAFEPLKTLRKYRVLREPIKKSRFGSAPVMGLYMGVRGVGTIHAGDSVSISIQR